MKTPEIQVHDDQLLYCLPGIIEGDCFPLEEVKPEEQQEVLQTTYCHAAQQFLNSPQLPTPRFGIPLWQQFTEDFIGVLLNPGSCPVEKVPPVTLPEELDRDNSLVKEAIELLKDYKESLINGTLPKLTFDPGNFLMRAELEAPSYSSSKLQFQELWEARMEKSRREVAQLKGSYEDKVEARMNSLFTSYLKDYVRDNANICDFLSGEGANCEGESKIVVADFFGVGLKPRYPKLFGFQPFEDHIQPVIYNKITDQVWDLMRGRKTFGVIDPILHPLIFAHGYLVKKGIPSPTTVEDLTLVHANPQLAEIVGAQSRDAFRDTNPMLTSNSSISLPRGIRRFSLGPIPERATLRSPYEKGVGYHRPVITEARFDDTYGKEAPLDFFVQSQTLYFKKSGLLISYRRLTTDEARRQFLMKLAHSSILHFIESEKEGLKNVLALLSSSRAYWTADRMERYELDETLLKLDRISFDIEYSGIKTTINDYSILELIEKRQREFSLTLITELNEMPAGERMQILRGWDYRGRLARSFLDVVANSKLVAVKNIGKKEMAAATISPECLIDIILNSESDGTFLRRFFRRRRRLLPVDSYRSPSYRWTPEFSQYFLKLSPNDLRDELFVESYLNLANGREAEQLTDLDPLCRDRTKEKLPSDIASVLKSIIKRRGLANVEQWQSRWGKSNCERDDPE